MATATARDLLTRAFRRHGFISEDEGLTAEQVAQGLQLLNDMMNGWEAEGIQYAHTDLLIDDVVNVPDQYVRSAMLLLMNDIADQYGRQVPARLEAQIAIARTALQAFYYSVPQAETDEGILNRRAPGWGTITVLTS
jgi:hypothetical protein